MSHLKKLSISHYRGFFEEQTIEFAIPDGQSGSGLTLITGPNNSGKTSVIEALLINERTKLKEGERHPGKTSIICVEDDQKNKQKYINIDDGSLILPKVEQTDNPPKFEFEYEPSRRGLNNPNVVPLRIGNHCVQTPDGKRTQARTNNALNMPIPEQEDSYLVDTLKDIHSNSNLKEKFNAQMKQIIPDFTSWTIDTNDQGDYIKYIIGPTTHQASFLGDGIISALRLSARLYNYDTTKPSILIIDEPELSLHPFAQKNLFRLISEAAKDRQIIVCTHSPYFVNWEDWLNGAKFIRLNKVGKECKINDLASSNDSSKEYAKIIRNNHQSYKNSHQFDLVAKEVMFNDHILFVEGSEDAGIIRKWSEQNKQLIHFNIFGYGSGGEGNISHLLEMAKKLGISKIAALYDDGVKSFETAKEQYAPKYCIQKLPTNDIRDKEEETQKCICSCAKEACQCKCFSKEPKEGIFDTSGQLKEKYKAVWEEIMNNFITYFSQKELININLLKSSYHEKYLF